MEVSMEKTEQKITVLIPAYEPDKIILSLVQKLYDENYHIIIVNDGSGPAYKEIFNDLEFFSTVLSHEKNRGKGQALKTGLTYIQKHCRKDSVVVTIDCDGQHSITDMQKVCAFAMAHPDTLILGSRMFNQNVPKRSQFGNTITRMVYRFFTGVNVYDTQTGLRAFGFGLIPFFLGIDGERYEYEMNVLLECSKKHVAIHEIPIQTIYYDNNSGSHFNAVSDSIKVYGKIFKFAASSLTGFVVDYSLYTVLVITTASMGAISIPLSNVCARIVSAGVNFTMNKKLVFQNDDSMIKTGIQYFSLAAGILAGNTFLLSLLTGPIGMNKFVAKIFTELTFFVLSWLVQRYVIFNKRSKKVYDKIS